jgi:hypothetical protein
MHCTITSGSRVMPATGAMSRRKLKPDRDKASR